MVGLLYNITKMDNHTSSFKERCIMSILLLIFMGQSVLGQTLYGCRLSNSNCSGNGYCELSGICTCKADYSGDNCETKIGKAFVTGSKGKGFVTFWVLFWVILNLLVPFLIYLAIKYFKDKNCDENKEVLQNIKTAICCCIKSKDGEAPRKSTTQNFGVIKANEENERDELANLSEREIDPEQAERSQQEKDKGIAATDSQLLKLIKSSKGIHDGLKKIKEKFKKEEQSGERVSGTSKILETAALSLPSITAAGEIKRQKKLHHDLLMKMLIQGDIYLEFEKIARSNNSMNNEIEIALKAGEGSNSLSLNDVDGILKAMEDQIKEGRDMNKIKKVDVMKYIK